MPIKCRLIDRSEVEKLQPGDMFYQKYVNREKEHLIVILPNGTNFDLTKAGDVKEKVHWDVSGEAPNITVNPSILVDNNGLHEEWHGWLKEGILSEA